MALFALLSIAMVIFSYLLMIALAAACVYLPYLVIASVGQPNAQMGMSIIPRMGNRSRCRTRVSCVPRVIFLAGTIRTDSLADSSSTMQCKRVRRYRIEERV